MSGIEHPPALWSGRHTPEPDGPDRPGDAPVLEARGLRCDIGRRVILDRVDLAVAPGEVLGIVGPNGSGKSTLLRTLAGLRKAADGVVELGGRPIGSRRPRERAKAIAFVAQEEDADSELLVGELVALGRTPHRPPWGGGDAAEREAVRRALEAVDMAGAERRLIASLSGGERRRVLLARGLAQDARLLVLDEPTNHLDVRHQLDVLDRVRRLDRTVVLSLHDLSLAYAFCDRVAVLCGGRLHAVGAPAAVLTPAVIAEAFGVDAVVVTHPRSGRTQLLLDLHAPRCHPSPSEEVSS